MLKFLSLQFSSSFWGPNKLCRLQEDPRQRDTCGSVCSQQCCMDGGILCQETIMGT